MKIAFLVPDNRDEFRRYDDPEPYFGPAPSALLDGLAGRPDCEVHIVCCVQKKLRSPAKLAANTLYHSLPVGKWGWLRGGYIGCIRAAGRKLREIKPDVVHGQGTERYCALAAVFSGYPNVLTIHGNMRLIAQVNRARPFSFAWLAARLEQITLPRSNGIVCISSYTQRNVAPLARATWLVPNAVNKTYFDVVKKPAPLKRVLCVGHITPRKNQAQLIRALDPLAAREKFELVLYGAAPPGDAYVEEVMELVRARPWCRCGGLADTQGIQAALAEASLSILPSLEDNCPMAVLESMAAGVPMAASRVGGIPDLISDGEDGLLFNPDQLEDIRSTVAKVLLNDRAAERMALAARAKAQRCFHPEAIARRHVEIYQQVCRESTWPSRS